jgi:hypothetical protein
MLTFWIHLVAFFQVVVLNCIQPVNWKYCYRVDQWLIPDLIHAWEIKTGKYHPYQTEKDYLNSLKENSVP